MTLLKTISIILGENPSLEERARLVNHAELFKPVLEELLEKSNQRIGVRHIMAQLNPRVHVNENDYFSC